MDRERRESEMQNAEAETETANTDNGLFANAKNGEMCSKNSKQNNPQLVEAATIKTRTRCVTPGRYALPPYMNNK